MTDRRYLPTVAELVDRLSIVLMKSIFIAEHREEYKKEISDIKHDIGLCADNAELIYAFLVLMLANRFIWENEAKARAGAPYDGLRATHSINGVRNLAKNVIATYFDERIDLKLDCLAADLPPEFGNWRVFD